MLGYILFWMPTQILMVTPPVCYLHIATWTHLFLACHPCSLHGTSAEETTYILFIYFFCSVSDFLLVCHQHNLCGMWKGIFKSISNTGTRAIEGVTRVIENVVQSLGFKFFCNLSLGLNCSILERLWRHLCFGYYCRKWTWWFEFKSWMKLFAFPIVLIPFEILWIQIFFL